MTRLGSPSPQKARRYVQLRLSSIVAMCFLVLTAISLAYVGGVMSGRSSTPSAVASGNGLAEAPSAKKEEKGQVLSPEELGFVRALRDEADPPVRSANPQNLARDAAHIQTGKEQPVANVGDAPAAPAVEDPGAPGTDMRDYVFQVAAFRDEDSVDALRQRLEGRGMRTRMQRSGKLYLVLVQLRGDAARAEELVHALDEMRLGRPVVLSAKTVAR